MSQIDPVAKLSGLLFEVTKYFETELRQRDTKCEDLVKENLTLKEDIIKFTQRNHELNSKINELERKVLKLEEQTKTRPSKVEEETEKEKVHLVGGGDISRRQHPVKNEKLLKGNTCSNTKRGTEEVIKDAKKENKRIKLTVEDCGSFINSKNVNLKEKEVSERIQKIKDTQENERIQKIKPPKENEGIEKMKAPKETERIQKMKAPKEIEGIEKMKSSKETEGIENLKTPKESEEMPINVIRNIFKFLPLKNLRTCREVSKQWNTLVLDEFDRRYPRGASDWNSYNQGTNPFVALSSDNKVETFLNVFKSKSDIQFPYSQFKFYPMKISTENLTKVLSQYGTYILNLYWKGCGDKSLINFLQYCPNIVRLWIDGINITACPTKLRLKSLRELNIFEAVGGKIIPHSILDRSTSKTLTVLGLFVDCSITNILSQQFQLRKLTIGFNDNLLWKEIFSFIKSQKELIYLKLVLVSSEPNSTQGAIRLPNMEMLETLDLEINRNTPKLKPIIHQLPKLKNLKMKIYDENNYDFLLGSDFTSVSELSLQIEHNIKIEWDQIFSKENLKLVILNTPSLKPVEQLFNSYYMMESFHLIYKIDDKEAESARENIISLLTGYEPIIWRLLIREKYKTTRFMGKENFLEVTKADRTRASIFQLENLKYLILEPVRRCNTIILDPGVIEHSLYRMRRLRRLELQNFLITPTAKNLLKDSHDVVCFSS